MKRLLPFVALLALGGSVAQATNNVEKVSGAMLSRISPSGEWAVSCGDGSFYVLNLKTDDVYSSEFDDDNYDAFPEAGYGSSVSDNGIVVGSITYNGTAAYWAITDDAPEGEWFELPVLNTSGSSAHAITPDGSRIVGYSYRPSSSFGSDGIGCVPLLWQRDDDGTYQLVELPYPDKDIFGRTPQYIIPLGISEDGKRIIGQVTEFAGFIHSAIVFDEQADGTWSYSYVHPEMQNMGLEFPEWPGDYDGPSYPSKETYMSDEELAAYNEATSNWSYGQSWPKYDDYMTEEEIAAYNAAYEEYQTSYSEWSDKAEAFYDVYYEAYDTGLGDLLMNQIALSGNGRYIAATKAAGDFWSGYSYSPVTFDLLKGDAKIYTDSDASLTYVNDYGAMLGVTTALDGYSRFAWVKPAGSDEFVRLPSYIRQFDAESADWLADNLTNSYIIGFNYGGDDGDDWDLLSRRKSEELDDDLDDNFGVGGDSEDDGYLYAEEIFDGLPVANKDMTKIVTWEINGYTDNYDDYIYSLIISLPEAAGVKNISTTPAKQLTVKTSRDGVITINGDASKLEVFSLAGNKVLSIDAPSSTVKTGLNSGLYLVRATDANGKTTVSKAVIAK